MSWTLVQRKGKRPQDRDIQLTLADLKAALLGGIGQSKPPQKPLPEWTCTSCATTNWQTRFVCRQCGEAKAEKQRRDQHKNKKPTAGEQGSSTGAPSQPSGSQRAT
eukprot:4129682-Amphidinium_carterae.1